MDERSTSTTNNPYVGPRTFEEADKHRFFGREREARELLALVIGERLTLFYAQSGAGKSSLINTRIIPALRDEGFDVLSVGRVSGDLPAGLAAVNNLFIFDLIARLNEALPLEERQSATTLAALTLTAFLGGDDHAAASTVETAPTVLIIDQFEEILTSHLDQWPQRADFFQQLGVAQEQFPNLWIVLTMREDYVAGLDPYIPLLPNRLHARFYMQRMTYGAALEAMTRPAAEIGDRPFAPGVAEELVDNLRLVQNVWGNVQRAELVKGEFVEPVQLQVVCFQLWENLGKAGGQGDRETGKQAEHGADSALPAPQSALATAYITRSDLSALAGEQALAHFVNQALAAYYEQALQKVLQMPNSNVSERELRDWFSTQLITREETRGLVHQGSEAEGASGLPTRAVKLLESQFLLRAESRAGGLWYELVHDRFVQPILQANRDWLLAQSNAVSVATRLWSAHGRDPARLLRGAQLLDAQRYATEHSRDLGEDERQFLQACHEQETKLVARQKAEAEERQRLEEQAHTAQRLRRFTVGLAILALLALLASFFAVYQRSVANQQTTVAVTEAAHSALAVQTAQAAQAEAVQQAAAAATAAAAAKVAGAEAERQSQLARSRQLAAQSASELSQNHYEPAILLAIEAGRVTDTLEAFATIRNAIANGWHTRTVLTGHTSVVYQALWNKDETRILTSSDDNTARIWDVHIADLMVAACHYVPRNFTWDEWSRAMDLAYRPTCPDAPIPPDAIVALQAQIITLVRQGEVLTATTQIQTLNRWLHANGQYNNYGIRSIAFGFMADGQALAQSGNITDAIKTYQQALKLDPILAISPTVEAGRFYAPTVVNHAAELAQSGNITDAVKTYQQALKLDPTLAITPSVEAGRQYVFGLVQQVSDLAAKGEITASLQAISDVQRLDPNLVITANTWNNLCWQASTFGHARLVAHGACEQTVKLASADELPGFRDSRGLARALTGNVQGALEDFKAFVAANTGSNVEERNAWIKRLEAGEAPAAIFDAATLEQLKGE